MLFTGANTVAVVNSIVGGASLAFLVGHFAGLTGGAVVAVGICGAVGLFGPHLLYEYWRRTRLAIPRPTAAP
jgi:hypothetical protein